MLKLENYTLDEKLEESTDSIVYRGQDISSKNRVIIKLTNTSQTQQRINFKREYEFTHDIQCANVVRSLALISDKQTAALIQEDFGGTTIKNILLTKKIPLQKGLLYAVEICKALEEVHQLGIIHKNINSYNIIINEETNKIKITGFDIALDQTKDITTIDNLNKLTGNLNYISPEQTGRINRIVDYRTDFYSFGVVLYEILTGDLPFSEDEPLKLIHAHLAKEPIPPHTINPEIPLAVSNLVMKLLSKSADDRYQGASGIESDLVHCLHQFQSTGKIPLFQLASADITQRFTVPQKLYGRDQEIATLLKSFEKACSGAKEIMLVTGYSGIGKTALIHEIDKSLTITKSFFTSGKFDQFLRHIPYSAMITAFKGLIRYLMSEEEAELNHWKEEIKLTLGDNIGLMMNIIPDLGLLIEKPKEETPTPVYSKEQQDRLNLAFIKLIQVFCKAEHPLVFFLDDLQWIDTASLNLLENLIKSDEIKYFYFIGAYRNNEVDNFHPLAKSLDKLTQDNVSLNKITLTPLSQSAIENLISDTVHRDINEVLDLADIVIAKTEGNPFFVIQFLMTLYQEHLVKFDPDKRVWRWDIQKIKQQNITDNVIELMIIKLNKLPVTTQHFLSLAACLGHQVDLQTLSIVSEKGLKDVYSELLPAVKEAYLLPISKQELSSENLIESILISYQFKFLHDRVQQAAYALTSCEEQLVYNLKIAQSLLENLSHEDKEHRLFEIVDHLNNAEKLIPIAAKEQWKKLNFRAAIKAKQAAAYENALYYLKKAMSALSEQDWEANYSETLNFYRERIELEFLNGDFETSQTIFREVLPHINTGLEKCEFYITPISQLIFLSNFREAIVLAKEALQHIDIDIPIEGDHLKEQILAEKAKFEITLGGRALSELINLPELTDQKIKLALAILNKVSTSAIFLDRSLYEYLVLKRINFCLNYGNDRLSCGSYASYGIAACGFWDQYVQGAESCDLSVKLSEKYNDPKLKTIAKAIQGFTLPWVKHYKYSIPLQEESIELGISSGELQYGMQNVHFKLSNLFLSGAPLEKLAEEAQKSYHMSLKYKFQIGYTIIEAYLLFINNLLGLTKNRSSFYINDSLNEEALVKLYTDHKIKYAETTFNLLKAIAFYLYGDMDNALAAIQKIPGSTAFLPGVVLVAQYTFYHALILCAKMSSPEDRERVENDLARLEIWKQNCPANFESLYNLVKAEIARLDNKIDEAVIYYSRAVKSAEENELIQQAALATELHGKFWLSLENKDLAKTLLERAQQYYSEWQAHAKVKWMSDQYADVLQASSFSTSKPWSASSRGLFNIDLSSLLKSSQAISTEITLSKLIQKLLSVLVENIGAQRGVLILKNQDQWLIEGEYDTTTTHTVLQSLPLSQEQNLAISVIQFVIRTKETLVLMNASATKEFANDPSIKKNNIKSLLCAPILHHNDVIGMLYFENNLATGTFTPERLEVLNILSAQIAISIENAKLYKSFESFVPQEFLAHLQKKNVIDVKPGDCIQRDMTVMFTDVRGFTSLSEQLTPKEVYDLLNKIILFINPTIKNHHGFIDKYLGDGIMALFEKPDDAIRAGIAMQRSLEAFNAERISEGRDPLIIGIGLNSGKLMLGIIGAEGRLQGSVLSDAVNLSSRLESLTKTFGSSLIVSEAVAENLDFLTRFLGKVAVVGKSKDVKIYEVLEAETPEVYQKKKANKTVFEEGLAFYFDKKFPDASVKFSLALEMYPQDKAAKIYLKNCANYMVNGVPENWSGTEIMKDK